MKVAKWKTTGVKTCPRCGLEKSATVENFYRCSRFGLAGWCKACEGDKKRAKRKTPERFSDSEKRECSSCDVVKPLSEFHHNARTKSGYANYCKPCQNAANRASHAKHREARNAVQSKRVSACPKSRMNYRILGLVRKALDRKVACLRPASITREFWRTIGYDREQLCDHLESLFLPDMGWHNLREWHIDHIKPVRLFSFESFECPQFKECWGLENLRPLWAVDNLRKGGKYIPPEG